MYVCKGCKRKLADDQFYPHPQMASGHLSFCKDCFKAKMRAHRAANIERFRAYDRWRGDLPHRVAARAAYQASRPPAVFSRAKKAWAARNPEKKKAHNLAQRIPRPEICQRCGAGAKLHRHHPDYSKPKLVEFLCASCHARVHREERDLPRTPAIRLPALT